MFDDSRISLASYIDTLKFKVTATDSNSCISNEFLNLIIVKNPTISLQTNEITQCMNDSLNLTKVATTFGSVVWTPLKRNSFENWKSYTSSKGIFPPSAYGNKGLYKIKINSTYDICANSDSIIINILPLPKPSLDVFIKNDIVKIKDYTSNIMSRKWFIDNVFYTNADTLIMSKIFAYTHTISLQITDKNGCTKDTVLNINPLGLINIYKSNIEIYPNPASNKLVLKQIENWVPSVYEIYDVLGKKVMSGVTQNKVETINLAGLKPGLYYLKYITDLGVSSKAFIKTE